MSTETISVGVRNDGQIDIDLFCGGEDVCRESECDHAWCFHDMTIDKAEFLHEQLGLAIEQARKYLPKPPIELKLEPAKPDQTKPEETHSALLSDF